MKLFGNTKSKVTKNEIGENVSNKIIIINKNQELSMHLLQINLFGQLLDI